MDNKNINNISEQKRKTSKLSIFFLSFMGVGFIPFMPGTLGTIAAIPFLLLINYTGIPAIFLIPIFLLTLAGATFITDTLQRHEGLKDPSWIVIDEVLGIVFIWILYHPKSTTDIIIAFVLFRLFDIIKIWPANYFDKKMEHGAGVMLDDLAAALHATAILYLIHYITAIF
jgi:phosphatidylglycerophosphatase A